MKKLWSLVAIAALSLALLFTPSLKPAYNPITPQRLATHMITYVNDEGKEVGLCTGTAVGPHVILTALHCDDGTNRLIRLDLSQRVYKIIGVALDGRDHIVYILDGPAFINTVTIHERVAVLGERVVSYGDGAADYPPHTYVGRVVVDTNGGDTSELDAADGTRCFTLPVIPGDSGSAVYGEDGSVVALITYQKEDDHTAVGFALAFPPEVLEAIKQQ